MTAEVVDGLLVAAIYIGGFFALVLLATVISEVLRRIFPNFDRKMFALFGLNIEDYDDDEEDDEPDDGKNHPVQNRRKEVRKWRKSTVHRSS